MTVAIAVRRGGSTTLAADRQTSMGWYRSGKVTKIVECAFGYFVCSGTLRMMQVVEAHFRDGPSKIKDPMVDIAESLRKALPDYGWSQPQDSDLPSCDNFEALFVDRRGRAWKLSRNFTVTSISRFDAIGCGSELAFGCAAGLWGFVDDAEFIARDAVSIASKFNPGCGNGIDVVTL